MNHTPESIDERLDAIAQAPELLQAESLATARKINRLAEDMDSTGEYLGPRSKEEGEQ